MAALVCDICGGKLLMQSGGVAKCDSCGMEYTKERIQEKVQEIKGTVKVDGPVETVKGDAEKERLLNMANDCLNKGNLEEARRIYSTVSKEYSNDWRGWWGIICSNPLKTDNVIGNEQYLNSLEYEYKMAISFAPESQKDKIIKHQRERNSKISQVRNMGAVNASKLKDLCKKHNYERAFDEVLRAHTTRDIVAVVRTRYVEKYVGNEISWRDDEYRSQIWTAFREQLISKFFSFREV